MLPLLPLEHFVTVLCRSPQSVSLILLCNNLLDRTHFPCLMWSIFFVYFLCAWCASSLSPPTCYSFFKAQDSVLSRNWDHSHSIVPCSPALHTINCHFFVLSKCLTRVLTSEYEAISLLRQRNNAASRETIIRKFCTFLQIYGVSIFELFEGINKFAGNITSFIVSIIS